MDSLNICYCSSLVCSEGNIIQFIFLLNQFSLVLGCILLKKYYFYLPSLTFEKFLIQKCNETNGLHIRKAGKIPEILT